MFCGGYKKAFNICVNSLAVKISWRRDMFLQHLARRSGATTMKSNDPLDGTRWRSRSIASYARAVARIEAELSVAVAAADNATNTDTAVNNDIDDEAEPATENNNRVRACSVIGTVTLDRATRNGDRYGVSRRRSRSRHSYSLAASRIEAELPVAVAAADNATGARTGNSDSGEAQPVANHSNNRARACGVVGATTHDEATHGGFSRSSTAMLAQLENRIHAPAARELSGGETSSPAPRQSGRPIDTTTGSTTELPSLPRRRVSCINSTRLGCSWSQESAPPDPIARTRSADITSAPLTSGNRGGMSSRRAASVSVIRSDLVPTARLRRSLYPRPCAGEATATAISGPRTVFSAGGHASYPVADSVEGENAVVGSRRMMPLVRDALMGYPPAFVTPRAVEWRAGRDATALRTVSARLDAAASAIDAVEMGVRSASDSLDSLLHLLESRPAVAAIAGSGRDNATRNDSSSPTAEVVPSTLTASDSEVGGSAPTEASASASTNTWPVTRPSMISRSAAMAVGGRLSTGATAAFATCSSGGRARRENGEATRNVLRGSPIRKPEESSGSCGQGRGEKLGLSQAATNLHQRGDISTRLVDLQAAAEEIFNADGATGLALDALPAQQAPPMQINNAGSTPLVPATEELGPLSARNGTSRRTNPSHLVDLQLQDEGVRAVPQTAALDALGVDEASTTATRLECASDEGGGDLSAMPREIPPVLGSSSSRQPHIAYLRRTRDLPRSLTGFSADTGRSIAMEAIASDPPPLRVIGAQRPVRGTEPAVVGATVAGDSHEESHRDNSPRGGSVNVALPALELEVAMDGIDMERERLMLEIARLRGQQNESLIHLLRLQQEQFLVRHRQVTTLSDIVNSFGRTVEAAGALPHGEDSSLGRISGDVVSTLRRMLRLLSATVPVAVSTISTSAIDVSVVPMPPTGGHLSSPAHPSQDDTIADSSPSPSSPLVDIRSAGAGEEHPGPYAVGGRVALRPAGDLTQEVINAALQALPRLAAAATALSGARRLQEQRRGGVVGDGNGAQAGGRDNDRRCSPETIAALPDASTSREDGSGNGGGNVGGGSVTGVARGCVICLSEGDTEGKPLCLLPCDHVFHRVCVGKWLRVQASCPTCRRQVPNVEVGPVAPGAM